MARLVPLSTLVTRCKKRADKESDSSVDEWKALISERYGEIYAAVVDAGWGYFQSTSDITATGATSYDEPDSLALISVDFIVNSSTGQKRPLRLLMPQERSLYAGATGEACAYAFAGDQIELYPKPSSGTYRVTYVPQSTDLSAGADNLDVDVINTDGEAALIWGVAAMATDKSEGDLRFRASMAAAALERLRDWAAKRALHETHRRIVRNEIAPSFYGGDGWFYPP